MNFSIHRYNMEMLKKFKPNRKRMKMSVNILTTLSVYLLNMTCLPKFVHSRKI